LCCAASSVITHASFFFKACLFQGLGSVIHAYKENKICVIKGGLRKATPVVADTMLIASLAISEFHCSCGFFLKNLLVAIKTFRYGLWLDSFLDNDCFLYKT
jgi:NADH-quinone oxidoreductase subunit L